MAWYWWYLIISGIFLILSLHEELAKKRNDVMNPGEYIIFPYLALIALGVMAILWPIFISIPLYHVGHYYLAVISDSIAHTLKRFSNKLRKQ